MTSAESKTGIELRLAGVTQGWERPRFNSKTGAVFTKGKAALGMAEIRRAWEEAGEPRLPEGAVAIEVVMICDRPKGHFNTKGELNKKGLSMPFPHNKKPDLDNAVKLIMDALNSRAYRDDVQVCKATVTRVWGDWPETQIKVYPMEDPSEEAVLPLQAEAL